MGKENRWGGKGKKAVRGNCATECVDGEDSNFVSPVSNVVENAALPIRGGVEEHEVGVFLIPGEEESGGGGVTFHCPIGENAEQAGDGLKEGLGPFKTGGLG